MSASIFMRLASDPAFRAAVATAPAQALEPWHVSPQQQRLLQLAAIRLQADVLPPRCAYWYPAPAPRTAGESLS